MINNRINSLQKILFNSVYGIMSEKTALDRSYNIYSRAKSALFHNIRTSYSYINIIYKDKITQTRFLRHERHIDLSTFDNYDEELHPSDKLDESTSEYYVKYFRCTDTFSYSEKSPIESTTEFTISTEYINFSKNSINKLTELGAIFCCF